MNNKNSILDVFSINTKKTNPQILTDYEIFKDKELLETLRTKIMDNILQNNVSDPSDFTRVMNDVINKTLEGYDLSNLERSHIFNLIDDEINGLGPLTELIDDENVTEIMVNSPSDIYVETDGRINKDTTVSFINDEHIIRTIQRLISNTGCSISTSNPIVDVRLNDGTKVNAIIPPLSPKGPVLTIKKYNNKIKDIDDLIRIGSLTSDMARYLEAAVNTRLNILVCGGSSSGKTTLLNVLTNLVNDNERVIVIEKNSELRLKSDNVVLLEAKKTGYSTDINVDVKLLLENALKMHPDRLILGELSGSETFLLLQSMNTGYDGTIFTIHSSGVGDAIARIETLSMINGSDVPKQILQSYIADSIDLVVNIERLSDGKKKIVDISEVYTLNDKIVINPIFVFNQKGLTFNNEVNGEYIIKDKNALINKKMLARGFDVAEIFNNIQNPSMPKRKRENKFIGE